MITELIVTVVASAVALAPVSPNEDERQQFGIRGFVGITPVSAPENVAPPSVPENSTPAPAPAAQPERDDTQPERDDTGASRSGERPALDTEPATVVRSGVLGVAANYVGTPYSLGGTTPAAFDCSGFTSYVFRQVGVNLPRSAAQQQAYATPVSNPQPGDLVFWGYPAWHVGIYAGNGMVYDAGNPGTGVIYRSVFSGVSGYGRV